MKRQLVMMAGLAAILLPAGGALAVDIETVSVGNPGNAGEWSGFSYGGGGPDRICGAVDYTYNIGKYEVTAGQYCEFLNGVAATDTYGLYSSYMDYDADPYWWGCNIRRTGSSGSYTYSVAGDWANRPVNYVSWGDAARFANWLHNGQPTGPQALNTTEDGAYYLNGAVTWTALLAVSREADWRWAIPTEDEWYKAAYHENDGVTGNYFDYPTGSDSGPSNDLVDPDPGNNATFYDGVWPDPAGHTIGSPYYRTEAGEHENSESPYDTFDQGGNVWEWNEAIIYERFRGQRGGSCISGHLQASYRGYDDEAFLDRGFRVSQVPEIAPLEVDLDIKPGSWPNPLNTISRGVLPLAICGSAEFDVMTIDPEAILVGSALGPIRWSYEDVATPFEGEPCEGHDLNGDGFMDLTLKFSTQELVSMLGLDLLGGQTVPLVLSGALTDGTLLTGSDCVWVLTPGDGNLDGLVDGLDYVAWSNNYMTGATWSEGDYNDDGVVDGLDHVAWSNNYQAGYGPGAAVPEPATLALLAIGALGLIGRRRK